MSEAAEPTVRIYECADCVTGFADRSTLSEHIIRTHIIANKSPVVDDPFDLDPSSESLEDLDGDDDDEDDYEPGDDPANASSRTRHHCQYCSKSFHRMFCLKRHERRHTGEKPFKCLECNKKFSDRSNLLQHERSRHSEAKTYVCTDCLKQFAQYNYLRRHLRSVHRNILSFICPEPCNHAFVTEQAWLQHLKTHRNNVKPITVNGPWPCKGSKTKIPGLPEFPTVTRKETAGGYRQQPEEENDTEVARPVAMKAFGNHTAVTLLSQVPPPNVAAEPHDWAPSDQGNFTPLPDSHFQVNGKGIAVVPITETAEAIRLAASSVAVPMPHGTVAVSITDSVNVVTPPITSLAMPLVDVTETLPIATAAQSPVTTQLIKEDACEDPILLPSLVTADLPQA